MRGDSKHKKKISLKILEHAGKKIDRTEKTDNIVYKLDVQRTERMIASAALLDIFKNGTMQRSTILSSWPFYEHLYREYGHNDRQIDSTSGNALLIGSMHALSSKAFHAMAEDVYKTEKSFVVDIRGGKDKKRPQNGTFLQANGLRLPFADETMRITQTNLLLHMIVNEDRSLPDEDTEQATTNRLLDEMSRVLVPGGQLLMREVAPRLDNEDKEYASEYNQTRIRNFRESLQTGLESADFTDITIIPAWDLQGVTYLFDPDRRFENYETVPSPKGFGIHARKK